MKDPRALVEKFCYKHPHFGIPNLMKYIAIASAVFWVLGLINPTLMSYMVFNPYLILHGQVWRLIAFMFYPPSTGWLAFIAIYFYYMIGTSLENSWGTAQFSLYVLMSAVLTVIYAFILYFVAGISVSLNAEFIYLSMFFAFATMFPDMKVLLFYIIPIKMKYLAIIDAVFFIYEIAVSSFPYNLVPVIALLNFFIFCGGYLVRRIPKKKSAETINFKKESDRIRKEQRASLYRHKCAVCGKTDTDYPNLEFRYCSKCAGYHCFCSEHINSHVHFTE